MKEIVSTSNAPAAIGPYSQAVKANGLVFCSGQIPLKPDGTLVEGDIVEQAKQVMANLKAVLDAAGSGFDKVVMTTIYLTNMADFQAVNEVYGAHFSENPPARATVAVKELPKGVGVEISMIAV